MNFACSTCWESLTPKSDVSTTPCGHVFHTICIKKWLQSDQNCSQCRKACKQDKIIKLYFSESESDNLLSELEEENKKLREEATLSKTLELNGNRKALEFQTKFEKFAKLLDQTSSFQT